MSALSLSLSDLSVSLASQHADHGTHNCRRLVHDGLCAVVDRQLLGLPWLVGLIAQRLQRQRLLLV